MRLFYTYQTITNEYTAKKNKYHSLFSSPVSLLEHKYNSFENELYLERRNYEANDFLKRIQKKKAFNWFNQISLSKEDRIFTA